MYAQQIQYVRTTSGKHHKSHRLSFWLGLAFVAALALQACNGLSSSSDQFRTVPGTGSGSTSALAINTVNHFQGHIAFVRNHQLYILSGKDGTVSALPAGNNVQDPAFSPDGSRLAYISRGASWSDLMVIDSKGWQPVVLTHNQGTGQQITCPNGTSEADSTWAANPIWTPDGSALYYLSDAQKLLKMSCGLLDLAVWKKPVQTDKPAQLVLWPARGNDTTGLPGAGGDANLSLRPGDSSELTYTHYAYDPRQSNNLLVQIFLATLDQPEIPPTDQPPEIALTPTVGEDGITPQQTLEASWSPDGKFLAYILRNSSGVSLATMRVSDPANGAPNFRDYANNILLLNGAVSYPVWSPDGKSLLYLEFKNNKYDLYLAQVTINGSTVSLQGSPIQLTQGGIDGDSRPSWTSA
jgi:Tol biopolymer transport system component